MTSAPRPQELARGDQPLLRVTSSVCDVAGVCCAVPCVLAAPCAYLCAGALSFMEYAPPPRRPRQAGGAFDRWYRAAIFTTNGGSLLQLLATQPAFWSFPRVEAREGYALHRVEVAPANACGACCFVPVVRAAEPHFRVRRLEQGAYSVRLNARVCGCAPRECSGYELNDVWRSSASGEVITSVKTRGFASCGDDFCVTMPSAGPAMFVAVDPAGGPTRADVGAALRSAH
jgi:hypothetical protein